jgi:hypothetical protein
VLKTSAMDVWVGRRLRFAPGSEGTGGAGEEGPPRGELGVEA